MEKLRSVLTFLGLGLWQVVQVKAFLKPMTRVAECEREIVEFFGGNAPPMVFVEWKNPRAIEIEMIAAASDEPSRASSIEFLTPPGMTASTVFSRLTRIYHPGTIYLSSLFGKTPGDGERQIYEVFSSLKTVLSEAGADLRHLAKATYYVTDELTSTKLNEIRREFYDPKRSPAASKASVAGTGIEGRTLAIDLIAVPAK